VLTATGEWKLHSLLLASRSEFFYRALAGQFAESRSKCIELHLEKAPGEEVSSHCCAAPVHCCVEAVNCCGAAVHLAVPATVHYVRACCLFLDELHAGKNVREEARTLVSATAVCIWFERDPDMSL
jgi:hypothetical protein